MSNILWKTPDFFQTAEHNDFVQKRNFVKYYIEIRLMNQNDTIAELIQEFIEHNHQYNMLGFSESVICFLCNTVTPEFASVLRSLPIFGKIKSFLLQRYGIHYRFSYFYNPDFTELLPELK